LGPNVQIVRAEDAHCQELAPRMRVEDRAEVWASAGLDPLEALRVSVKASAVAYAALFDGEVAALFGVSPAGSVLGTAGVVWALTGDLVERHPRAFLRYSEPVLAHLLEHYPLLMNMVDDRYSGALRWVKWLGFTVGPPEPFGRQGRPFRRIEMRRDADV
jgi:hypothetical protein